GSVGLGVLVDVASVEAGCPGDGPLPITTAWDSVAVLPARSLAVTFTVWAPSVAWPPSHAAVAVIDLAGGLGVEVTLSSWPSTVTLIEATLRTPSPARRRITTAAPA